MRVAREAGPIREILSRGRQSGTGNSPGSFKAKEILGLHVEARVSNFNGVSRVKGSARRWRKF